MQEICNHLNKLTKSRSVVLVIDNQLVAFINCKHNHHVITIEDTSTTVKADIDNNSISNQTIEQIKAALEKVLPVYSLPKVYIEIDEFPVNINQKVDRQALISKYMELKNKKC